MAEFHSASPIHELMLTAFARNWWAVGIRGTLAVIFGLIALLVPGATMLSLVLVFAAYAFADGVFAIVSAMRAADANQRWDYLILEGVVDICAAALAVMWPGPTVVAFVYLVAFWAILTGVLEIGAAVRLKFLDGRAWLVFGGIVSILYGGVLLAAPLLGAVVLTWWIGAYALVFGVSLLVLAFKLRSRLDKHLGLPKHATA